MSGCNAAALVSQSKVFEKRDVSTFEITNYRQQVQSAQHEKILEIAKKRLRKICSQNDNALPVSKLQLRNPVEKTNQNTKKTVEILILSILQNIYGSKEWFLCLCKS